MQLVYTVCFIYTKHHKNHLRKKPHNQRSFWSYCYCSSWNQATVSWCFSTVSAILGKISYSTARSSWIWKKNWRVSEKFASLQVRAHGGNVIHLSVWWKCIINCPYTCEWPHCSFNSVILSLYCTSWFASYESTMGQCYYLSKIRHCNLMEIPRCKLNTVAFDQVIHNWLETLKM